jgi:CBS domain containing-hemolysin-like protein
LLILFLSEIIPKTLGAVYWRRLAAPTALFVQGLIYLLYPLILVSEFLTRLVARGKGVHVFNREEYVAMAGVGEATGHIDPGESRIIRNLFRMGSLKARDVMTPRTVIVALAQDQTVDQALEIKGAVRFSRLPVYGKDVDNVTGFVLKDTLLRHKAEGKGAERLEGLRRDILTVPETMPLSGLLDYLLERRQHIAVVVDEYGGTEGLVSLEDVLETLLGAEIVDEADRTADMQALARKLWAQRARNLGLEVEEQGD